MFKAYFNYTKIKKKKFFEKNGLYTRINPLNIYFPFWNVKYDCYLYTSKEIKANLKRNIPTEIY